MTHDNKNDEVLVSDMRWMPTIALPVWQPDSSPVARPNQSPPLGAPFFTFVRASAGAVFVVIGWILAKIDPRPLNAEGGFALTLSALVGDAGAAFWLRVKE